VKIFLAVFLCALAAGPARTQPSDPAAAPPVIRITNADKPFSLELALEGRYLGGYSEYTIKGSDWFWGSWESRLKWPLDCFLLGGKASAAFQNRSFVLNLSFLTNVTDDPGELEDYDWVAGEKTSKGVLDTSLDARILDLSFYWNMVQKPDFILGLGLGYSWQHFYWEGDSELTQTEYDSWYNRYWGIVPGTYVYPRELWITYKIDYHLPYLGVAASYSLSPNFELSAEGKLLLVYARDRDDHVYRMKVSDTDYYGAGMELALEAVFRPTEWAFAALELRGSVLGATGDQDQEFYGGEYAGEKYTGIDAETESLQGSIGLRAGVRF